MLIAVPFMVAAIYATGSLMFPAMFVAVFFVLVGTGPTNAALVNSVSANIRSTALAVNVFIIHLLGDAFSPTLIGRISDKTGSLQIAFWVAFAAAGISGLILLYGAKFAPRFQVRASMIVFDWTLLYWISGLLLALIWLVPALQLALHFSEVADLTQPEWNPPQDSPLPSLTIVVPARNEEAEIEAALRSLLQLNYPQYQIVAVNDRSTDQTGAIMERLAAEPASPESCECIHVRDLPSGWLGKVHAMWLGSQGNATQRNAAQGNAAQQTSSDWLLFTDADCVFHPDYSAPRHSLRDQNRHRPSCAFSHRAHEDPGRAHDDFVSAGYVQLCHASVEGARSQGARPHWRGRVQSHSPLGI